MRRHSERTATEDERTARAAWSALAEPGDMDASALICAHGPAGALDQVRHGVGPDRWHDRLPDLLPDRDLAILRRLGGRLLIPTDDEWPAGLIALGSAASFCLWVRGPLDLASATTRAVAIVGARSATPYGEHVARQLAEGCARRGISVVSSAAVGIDGCASRAALAVPGPTIAVLACGIDRAYPRGHEELITQIGTVGALISEVSPGASPTRMRFHRRNRLIAALAAATVTVEAVPQSGTTSTATWARSLHRPLGAVPGPITSPQSAGCHQLLREGAVCITAAHELAELAESAPTPNNP